MAWGGRLGDQSGTVTAEHVTVVLLVAAVIAGVWSLAVPERTAVAGEEAVDCLFSGDPDCELSAWDGQARPPAVPAPPGLEAPRPPAPQPAPSPEPVPDPTADPEADADPCADLPPGESDECHLDPTEFHEIFTFQVGECLGAIMYSQVAPGVDSLHDDVPFVHDGTFHIEGGMDVSAHEGCRVRMKVQGQKQGIWPGDDLGWSEWSEDFGEPVHWPDGTPGMGQELVGVLIEVVQPDGGVTCIHVRPGDGTDANATGAPVISEYPVGPSGRSCHA